eukprot:scaffold334_cov241-Pinguiococcus_pyrenoidosus.AAC.53
MSLIFSETGVQLLFAPPSTDMSIIVTVEPAATARRLGFSVSSGSHSCRCAPRSKQHWSSESRRSSCACSVRQACTSSSALSSHSVPPRG